jgi:phage-related protein
MNQTAGADGNAGCSIAGHVHLPTAPAEAKSCRHTQKGIPFQVRILFYVTPSGRRPVEEFIQAQERDLRAAISRDLDRLSLCGRRAPGVSVRCVAGPLWEIRVSAGRAARMFYCLLTGGGEDTLILLHAYLKKSRKAPRQEIETAQRRMKEILS